MTYLILWRSRFEWSYRRTLKLSCTVLLPGITVSFSGVNSTVSIPNFMSHASIPEALRATKQIPRDLVRVSIGLEDVDDLIADLSEAIERATSNRTTTCV
jgi:cystathionine beta-lyase